jgi:hypothetical protein
MTLTQALLLLVQLNLAETWEALGRTEQSISLYDQVRGGRLVGH